jgi:hypothetical protein
MGGFLMRPWDQTCRSVALSAGLIVIVFSTSGAAASGWSCSVIDDGKPQVQRFTVQGSKLSVSDWMSRLGESLFKGSNYAQEMHVLEDSKNGLLAVGEAFHSDPGERSNFGARVVTIDKRTGELTNTLVTTSGERNELKGNCSADSDVK